MARMDPKRKLELGRRYALKEITIAEAVKEYGCHKSVVWDARKKWLAQQAPEDAHDEYQKGFGAVEKAPPGPQRPPVDHTYVDELEKENQALHAEVRTLQKLLMTVGRAL